MKYSLSKKSDEAKPSKIILTRSFGLLDLNHKPTMNRIDIEEFKKRAYFFPFCFLRRKNKRGSSKTRFFILKRTKKHMKV